MAEKLMEGKEKETQALGWRGLGDGIRSHRYSARLVPDFFGT